MTKATPPEIRFWAKVEKTDGCWNWKASFAGKGYPLFYDGTRLTYAHRFSYILHKGPIPEGKIIDHTCHNTTCVNPAHLEAVTQQTNLLRAVHRPWFNTHCPHGHPYSPENTYMNYKGQRKCRICAREYDHKRHPRKVYEVTPEGLRKRFCKNGHPLSGDNAYAYPSGRGRTCVICKKERAKLWNQRAATNGYYLTPEYKAKKKAYSKIYWERPEVKERAKERKRILAQQPGYKERKAAENKAYYERKKAERLALSQTPLSS